MMESQSFAGNRLLIVGSKSKSSQVKNQLKSTGNLIVHHDKLKRNYGMKRNSETEYKSLMAEFCDQAGCSEKRRIAHIWKWEERRWHSHPTLAFVGWFEPDSTDPVSSVSVGGHPDARRRWARKDPGVWKHKWYGTSTLDAWNSAYYVEQFDAWQRLGSPESEPFVSIAAPYERQQRFFSELKHIISLIGKPMPKPEVKDYDNAGFQPY